MREQPILYSFFETTAFMRHIERLASMDILFAIQQDLLKLPNRGDVIRGAHGARKARIGDPAAGRGKRGSYRYIYLYLELKERIYLLYLYPKNVTARLTPAQVKQVGNVVDQIKEAVSREEEKAKRKIHE